MSSDTGSQSLATTSSSEVPSGTSIFTQPTSSTDVPTTSTTPPISNTALTPSSAGQSTPATVGTITTSSTSAFPTSSATTATMTTSSFTSQVPTTLLSTDPAGSVVYITTSFPSVLTTSISSITGTGNGNSHTGVIVGAVVGGVAGITILVFLLLCIRKQVRKDEFDGNFDPDHVVGRADGSAGTLPHVDLAEEVTPFPQSYTDQGSSRMRQYGDSPYIDIPSSLAASGQTSSGLYSPVDAQSRRFVQHPLPPAGAYVPPVNRYGSTGEWHSPHLGDSPPPSTSSYYTSSTRGAKEREALGPSGQGQALGLATQPETTEDVLQHQDAGRAPIEDHSPPKEIPPAYESIPQD